MAPSNISRPFAYNNTGFPISGTTPYDTLVVGDIETDYSSDYGGIKWWMGPDEDLGYVIGNSRPGGQPVPSGVTGTAQLGFWRSKFKTDESFLNLANYIGEKNGQPPFANTTDAENWLNSEGYYSSYNLPTPTPTASQVPATPTPTETSSPTPTPTVTPTSTDLTNITTYTISGCTSLNEFVANLGPGALAPGDIFYFEFTGGTPSGCYRIVNKINAVPTDGTTPLYFYTSCALCVAAREVTPTPSVTQTPTTTPSVTNTQTPTLTPTPSTSPIPVTGYGYNLVVLPYQPPTSGNTIFPTFATPSLNSGTTNPNTFTTNGVYWNTIDNLGFDRSSYYNGMTGVSVTAYFTQNGDTSIYSGSTTAFTFEGPPGQEAFNYNPNSRPNQLVLIQSASTNFVTGQTVYISYTVNGAGVTPTPTATSVTPTPTPTSGTTGDGWFFYYADNNPVVSPPANNGNTAFIPGAGLGTYNPNYTGGTLSLYFNNNNSAGTSYASQFSTLDTAGGTITISQGSSIAIYSGTSTDYQSSGTYLNLNVNRSAQMIQSASTPFVSGTSINVVVS